ncbi:hypothetical protein IMZ48_17945 [Candidatus Bathyarchaeota archaeon]|nr:hypothetical protein [Candidatus Bathyarchaeota archaeon]
MAERGSYGAKSSFSYEMVRNGSPAGKGVESRDTNLLLGQLVGEVGNHDLGLGRDAVRGRATLPALLQSTVLVLLALALLVGSLLVCDIRQRLVLTSSDLTLDLTLATNATLK